MMQQLNVWILLFYVAKAALTILFGRRAPTRVFCPSSEEKINKNENEMSIFFLVGHNFTTSEDLVDQTI